MPTIDANLNSWDKDWGHDGEDWSQAWGSSASMWRGSVWPRIGRFLPATSILEIAPGRGRLTEFLLPNCERYVGIDLAQTCVDACRGRFEGVEHARFEVTDGKSLPSVDDGSIDFAFSWDSLVHADATVLQAYLTELARALRPGDGYAFLHHSNLAAHVDGAGELTVENPHWRDPSVSAEVVRRACADSGLDCRVQELIQWGVPYRNDCFTLVRRPAENEQPVTEPIVLEHPSMNDEMALFRGFEESYWRG